MNRTHATPRRLAGNEGFYSIVDPRPRVGVVTEVYEGRSPSGLPVAIKVARDVDRAGPVLATERRVREAVQAREPRAAEWLSALLDTGEDELGRPFLVHPWFDFNLVEWVEAEPDPAQRLAVAELAARTIGYVHRCNLSVVGRLVHRSLKPHSLLVKLDSSDRPTQVVLSNLGQAGARGTVTSLSWPPEDMQSYLPPEQMMPIHANPDATMDMHAIAAIVVWLLTGRAPQAVISRGTMLGNVGARASDLLGRKVRQPDEDARLADLLRYPLSDLYRLDLMAPLDRFDEQRVLMAVVPESAPVDIGRKIGDAAHGQLIPALRHALHPRFQERARDTRRLVSALSAVRKLAEMVPINRQPRAKREEPAPYTEPMTDPGLRRSAFSQVPAAVLAPKPTSVLDQDSEDTVIFCPDVDLSDLKRIWDEKRARQQAAAAAARPTRRPGEVRDLTEQNETVIVAMEAEIRALRAELLEKAPAAHVLSADAKMPGGNKGVAQVKGWKGTLTARSTPDGRAETTGSFKAETTGSTKAETSGSIRAETSGSTKAETSGSRKAETPRAETSGPVKPRPPSPGKSDGSSKAEVSARAETSGPVKAAAAAQVPSTTAARPASSSPELTDPRAGRTARPPEPPPFQRPARGNVERPVMAAEATMDLPMDAITEMIDRATSEQLDPPKRTLPPPTKSVMRSAPPEATPASEPQEADTVIWQRDFDVSDLQQRWGSQKSATPVPLGLPLTTLDREDPEERVVASATKALPEPERVQSVQAIAPLPRPQEPSLPPLRQSRDEAHDRPANNGVGRGMVAAGLVLAVLLAGWIVLQAGPTSPPPDAAGPAPEVPVPPPLGAGPVRPAALNPPPAVDPKAEAKAEVTAEVPPAQPPATPQPPAAPVAMPPAALPMMLALTSELNPSLAVNGMPLAEPTTLLTPGTYQIKYTWGDGKNHEVELTLQYEGGAWTVFAGDTRLQAPAGKRVVLTANPDGAPKLELQPLKR